MPVPPLGLGVMSKMMLSGRAGSPDTPPTPGKEPVAAMCCSPYKLPPGCTAEYRFAVESAKPAGRPDPLLDDELSRLKALAVLAFCAEMTRLPGHCAPRFTPENATAHTTPSRFTMVAHI